MIFRKYVSIEEAKKLFPDHDERRNKEYMTFEEFHEALEAGKIKDLIFSDTMVEQKTEHEVKSID